MLRLVYHQTQTAEGSTDGEAERAAASLDPIAGFEILAERTEALPRRTIAAVGASVDEARAEVRRLTPAGAQIIAEKVISQPDGGEWVFHAADEASAIAEARALFGAPSSADIRRTADDEKTAPVSLVDVRSATVREPGRRGFLGIGAKPARYDIVLERKACVERTYFLGWRFVRTVGVEVRSATTLQRCARSDNLIRDRDFEQATGELAADGAIGSLALARLIDACRESWSAAILWPLRAAREAEPTASLIGSLEAALGAKQSGRTDEGLNWLAPELSGDRHIGWSDATFIQLRALAAESLAALRGKPSLPGAAPLPGNIAILCARCNAPPSRRRDDELLCEEHFREA